MLFPSVPSPIAGIKIIYEGGDSVVASWLPPTSPNGEILYYSLTAEAPNNPSFKQVSVF